MRPLGLTHKAYSMFITPREMYIGPSQMSSQEMGRVGAGSPVTHHRKGKRFE